MIIFFSPSFLLASILFFSSVFSIDVDNVLSSIEQATINLAGKIEIDFINRCSQQCNPSFDGCSSILPDFFCDSEFKNVDCPSHKSGKFINDTKSIVKLADKSTPMTNSSAQNVKEMICATSALDQEFINVRNSFPTIKWNYFGSYNGIHRMFPGIDFCDPYDPRLRPWYIAAASGAKNLMMILDMSRSMENAGKIQDLRSNAQGIIDTLSITDWIGVISFNTKVTSFNEILVRASSQNKQSIKSFIAGLTPDSVRNYEIGLREAFRILNNTFQNEYGVKNCATIVIFISDGDPLQGEQNPQNLLNIVKELDQYNTTMFTYGLGSDIQTQILQLFACNFHGIYQLVPTSSDLKSALSTFTFFTSLGLNRTTCIWTEPYIDAAGLGWVTTVAYPVYNRSVNPPFLLGVVAADMVMSDIQKLGQTANETLNYLIMRSQKCSAKLLTECNLQFLRGNHPCNSTNLTCPIATDIQLCATFQGAAFMQGSKHLTSVSIEACCGAQSCQSDDECCGQQICPNTKSIIIGSVIGGVAAIVIIIIILKKYGSKCKKKQPPNSIPTAQTHIIGLQLGQEIVGPNNNNNNISAEGNGGQNNVNNKIEIQLAPGNAVQNSNPVIDEVFEEFVPPGQNNEGSEQMMEENNRN